MAAQSWGHKGTLPPAPLVGRLLHQAADQACEGLSLGHGVVGKVSRSSPRDHAWRHGPAHPRRAAPCRTAPSVGPRRPGRIRVRAERWDAAFKSWPCSLSHTGLVTCTHDGPCLVPAHSSTCPVTGDPCPVLGPQGRQGGQSEISRRSFSPPGRPPLSSAERMQRGRRVAEAVRAGP